MGQKTPLYESYSDVEGVKIIDFGGWDLPVQFAGGILAEHRSVREDVGLFDVSHMGEILVEGDNAALFLDNLVTNQISGAEEGRCLYTPMCYPDGGTVDDLLVYVLGHRRYLLVVNAANTAKDRDWITEHSSGYEGVEVTDVSSRWAQLALQGPRSEALLAGHVDIDLTSLLFYRHAGMVSVAGRSALVSRTGYTGEDGFEIYLAPEDAPAVWEALTEAGARPCGLGARDTLRLESRLPLYGHELTSRISPLEAGLGMFVKLDKDDFVGKTALSDQKAAGVPRRLVGLKMIEPGVPREGYTVFAGEKKIGIVTSGAKSPTLEAFIALALVERGAVGVEDEVTVDLRGRRRKSVVVKTPFYKRSG